MPLKPQIRRIAIIGPPGAGKTTLGEKLSRELHIPLQSTDSVIHLGWSNTSLEVANWLNQPSYIIEGVALPRAFRKWQWLHPKQPPPVDKVIKLKTVWRRLKPGEIAMAKGIETVFNEVKWWLGKLVEVRSEPKSSKNVS